MSKTVNIRKAFAAKLKDLRTKAGYSILDLARLSGVSRQHIRDLEMASKAVTIRTLCKLANALGLPIWKLLHFGTGRCKW